MPLRFPSGEPFSTGSTPYSYVPATELETHPRLILEVEIEGIMTEAMLDTTGGVYLLCTPNVAKRMDLSEENSLSGVKELLFRGVTVQGRLHRVNLTLFAEEGESFTLKATAFVPHPDQEESWGDIPCILGLFGCLERVRFAVDPYTETFYFGPIL